MSIRRIINIVLLFGIAQFATHSLAGPLIEVENVEAQMSFDGEGRYLVSAPRPETFSELAPLIRSFVKIEGETTRTVSRPFLSAPAGGLLYPAFVYNGIVTATANGSSVVSQPNVVSSDGVTCPGPPSGGCFTEAFRGELKVPFNGTTVLSTPTESIVAAVAVNAIGNPGSFDIAVNPSGSIMLRNTYVNKDEAFLRYWKGVKDDLAIADRALTALSYVTGVIGGAVDVTLNLVSDGIKYVSEGLSTGPRGAAIAIGVGVAVATLVNALAASTVVGGTIVAGEAAVLGAIVGLTGAFVSFNQLYAESIYNDPPAYDFQNVAQYSPPTVPFQSALGSEFDGYMTNLVNAGTHMVEAAQGTLNSMERYQGAMLAGDLLAADRQLGALELFYQNSAAAQRRYAELVGGLPDLLVGFGFEDIPFSTSGYYAATSTLTPQAVPAEIAANLTSVGVNIDWQAVIDRRLAMPLPEGVQGSSAFGIWENYASIVPAEGAPTSVPIPGSGSLLMIGVGLLTAVRRFRSQARSHFTS